ncbi:hypothetical protein COW36_15065 [bacterium (Candidatus Blackallbacteria) CG17_big_fil_post_rev_8_21_14_2_50_48_46]|uniref:Uncharacterized protein n=1 Tax=bacterium (Candidatus Blackallbacteria) CG17_big_fil_post_rev_8_21_14_2_50_48_46 TaxID=2014261 RepID=A0A2M7G2K9_9BACT|nr:MAG: hypothetical protein COW64_11485 [bacterium (Candidatus Blackallbacteria) CG18_big_fil_WC_8_21_14_2_50_49_26]PIW16030.1 MAG: hypothetical protein COW36_15065 [bacterium (Candidatus Blackallbacteria) CG17_big_fil_post_rev_8_21_14_2_50_48_46]PIW50442.1 MAG: hypothetical protein COW20_02780 [bacterium (Candidatus Blackallbacteria) CG13_big_fil_rev_8_21_14_2_50_49_14]
MAAQPLTPEMMAQLSALASSGQHYLQEWTQEHVSQPLSRLQTEGQKLSEQIQYVPKKLSSRQRKWVLIGLLFAFVGFILIISGVFVSNRKKTHKPALW